MSATQPAPEPAKEIIAPRHESLRKEFDEALRELQPGYGEVRLSSQDHAMGFYTRHGFTVCSERFMDCNIAHHWMKRSLA